MLKKWAFCDFLAKYQKNPEKRPKKDRKILKRALFFPIIKGPPVTTNISLRVVQGMRKGNRALAVSTRAIKINIPSKNISYEE